MTDYPDCKRWTTPPVVRQGPGYWHDRLAAARGVDYVWTLELLAIRKMSNA